MKILEVNDNDIYGKIFNGYTIMKELNQRADFDVKQLVISKLSNNINCKELYSSPLKVDLDYRLHVLEHNILSTHSLLSSSTIELSNNKYYNEADLVHFHQVHNSRFSLPMFFEMAKRKPTIISLHDPWFLTGRCVHPLDCDKWKMGCKKCDHLNTFFDLPYDNSHELWNIKSLIKDTDVDLIVHSKFMYDLAKQNPYTKNLRIHEIPLGIDMSKYDFKLTKEEAKKKLNIFENDIVLFFREQETFKGTSYVIEALKKIENKNNITLLTCSQKGLLKELENDYNIVELGVIDEEQMLLCYNAADIFLMPSICESFGMMAVEAMASQLPTIVFDNTALPSTTNAPDVGILVKNLDSNDLYKKIDYYINHPKEREKRGLLSKEFIRKKYDYRNYFDSIASVYKEAYNNQKYKLYNNEKNNETIDYNNYDVKKTIFKLNLIHDELINDSKPFFLNKEQIKDDKIKYSDINVINLINKFNKYIYGLSMNKIKSRYEVINATNEEKDNTLNPKVSIIIPVYNGEKYVSLAIDSALRQTYTNLEVIVVNDGSKDNTDKICKSYGNKIKYIKKENGGVSSALNEGIKNMSGDYFSWLSHDDLYYPEKVEIEINYLKENNLLYTNTIVYSNYSLVDAVGTHLGDRIFDSRSLNIDSAYAILKGGINGLTLLIPKKAFFDVSLFDEKLRCVQDYQLWFTFYKYGYNFVHIPNVLTVTRIHKESDTNTNSRYVIEGNKFWIDTINYFKDNDKIRLYGSIYNYYYSLYNFFNGGPYFEVIDYCKKKYEEIEKKNINIINDYKVSIIVVYNEDNFASKTLNSVLNQSFKNIEIILINNGSRNDDIINKYVNNNNIKYIKLKNKKSEAFAINEGINNSTGEYISFINQGDVFDKEKTEKQLLKMVLSNEVISHTSYYEINEGKSYFIDSGFQNGYVFNVILNEPVIDISTVMVKKSFIINDNLYFEDNNYEITELFFLLNILYDNRILGIRDPLSYINRKESKNPTLKSIVDYICHNNKFSIEDYDISKMISSYLNSIRKNDYREIEKEHIDELNRYEYLQTNEWKNVSNLRNKIRKISFRKEQKTYMLDNNAIKNSRLNKYYRKLRKIKCKIKK